MIEPLTDIEREELKVWLDGPMFRYSEDIALKLTRLIYTIDALKFRAELSKEWYEGINRQANDTIDKLKEENEKLKAEIARLIDLEATKDRIE